MAPTDSNPAGDRGHLAPGVAGRTAAHASCPAEKKHRLQDLAIHEAGNSAVEMALSLPVLFTLMFCFMELCLAFYSRNMISECAREGTRYAMFRGATCPTSASPTCEVTATQVNTFVSGIGWPNLGGGTMTVNTTYPSGNEAIGSPVKVQVTYVFPFRMPFVPHNTITMTTSSQTNIVQ